MPVPWLGLRLGLGLGLGVAVGVGWADQCEHRHDGVLASRADAKVALGQRGAAAIVAQVHALATEPERAAQRARLVGAVGQLGRAQLKEDCAAVGVFASV